MLSSSEQIFISLIIATIHFRTRHSKAIRNHVMRFVKTTQACHAQHEV